MRDRRGFLKLVAGTAAVTPLAFVLNKVDASPEAAVLPGPISEKLGHARTTPWYRLNNRLYLEGQEITAPIMGVNQAPVGFQYALVTPTHATTATVPSIENISDLMRIYQIERCVINHDWHDGSDLTVAFARRFPGHVILCRFLDLDDSELSVDWPDLYIPTCVADNSLMLGDPMYGHLNVANKIQNGPRVAYLKSHGLKDGRNDPNRVTKLEPAPWRDNEGDYLTCYYHNTVLDCYMGYHMYFPGKDAPIGYWTPWSSDKGSFAPMPCPRCITDRKSDPYVKTPYSAAGITWMKHNGFKWDMDRKKWFDPRVREANDALDKMLSVVMNTCPTPCGPYVGACCCGHPWLETACEDYALWMAGVQDDEQRQERRQYPSISEWRATHRYGTGNVMGVDQTEFGFEICIWKKNGETIKQSVDGDGFVKAMNLHQIDLCVIDQDPLESLPRSQARPHRAKFQARQFERMFPGRVFLCRFGNSPLGDDIALHINRDNATCIANRMEWAALADYPAAYARIARRILETPV